MRSGDDVLTKKISKTRGRKDSKTLNRHERKNFSLFSFVRHFEGFPEGKSQSENSSQSLPSKSLVNLSTIERERKRHQNVLIVLVKKKALGSSNFVLFVI